MIRIQNHRGRYDYVSPDAVASIQEAGTSSQWHGIRSFVKLFDGRLIESSEDAALIAERIDEAKRGRISSEIPSKGGV